MGSNHISAGKIIFFLLVTALLGMACVNIPPEQAVPGIPDSVPQSESVLVDPVVSETEPLTIDPQPVPEAVPEPIKEPLATPDAISEPATVIFDPTTVSAEVKELTFADVKRLIQNLNTVIQTRNYDLWITNLTQDYLEFWSDPETLARLSESPVLRRQNITLSSLRDYFIHVVYPSRQNDRVDDIEFIGETRIKAIIINPKGERLVLYNLEKIGDTWKIANWR
jgi:hypothetical protein